MSRTDHGDGSDPAASRGEPSGGRTPRGAIDRFGSDCRDAGVLARAELRAKARQLLGDARKLLATAFLVFTFGLVFPLLAWEGAAAYGRGLAGGEVPVGRTGAVFAAAAVAVAYLGGSSGFGQEKSGRIGPLVGTSIPPTAVALGRLASELVQTTVVLVAPALALTLAVTVGAGGPVAPLVLVLAALPVALAGTLVGRTVGDAFRLLNDRVGLSLWTKALLFVGGSVAVFVGTQAVLAGQLGETGDAMSISIPPLLPGEPLQAYASVVLAPLGASPRPLGAAVGLGLLVAIPVGLALAIGIETALLRSEAAGEARRTVRSRGVPRPFTVTPAGRVAWRYLLRTRRDPRSLAHLTPLLFGALGGMANAALDPESLRTLGPGAAVIAGVTLAGATYCLNPLGDDRDQLPLLLTSVPSAATLLRGRALAGTVLGLALAIGVAAPLGLLEHSVPFVVGQSILAIVLALTGAGTALGIGAAVPKFERREYMSIERPHPSMTAVVSFMFGGLIVGIVGLALVAWTVGGADLGPLAVGWIVYLAVVLLPGVGGYAYAVRRFDALALDEI